MYQVAFKHTHVGCPLSRVSLRYPRSTMSHPYKNVYEVTSVRDDLKAILDELKQLTRQAGRRIRHVSLDEDGGRLVIVTAGTRCFCSKLMRVANCPSVTTEIERHHCIQVQPTVFRGGWEYRNVVAFKSRDIKNLLKVLERLGEVEVIRQSEAEDFAHDILTVALSRLFSDVTHKQLEALLEALDKGYYKIPRKITVSKLAERRRVPRTTYEEHMHKAETKVLRSLTPFLRVYYSSAGQR